MPHLEEDNRLLPMLTGLTKAYLGKDYANKKSNTGQITADMIEPVSKLKAFTDSRQRAGAIIRTISLYSGHPDRTKAWLGYLFKYLLHKLIVLIMAPVR